MPVQLEAPARVEDTLPSALTYVFDEGGCDTSALPKLTCDLGPWVMSYTQMLWMGVRTKAAYLPG